MAARAYIQYNDGVNLIKLDLGTIESVSNSITKRVMVTPIVTRPMSDSFPVESGNSQAYSLTFKRTHSGTEQYDDQPGTSPETTKLWSNRRWYEALTDAVDRWQARTDGVTLHYEDDESEYYLPDFEIGCYIKSIDRVYNVSYNEMISGSITFAAGTMYVNSADSPPPSGTVRYDDMDILMSDVTREHWYVLYSGVDHNCISDVSITGGSESPFEYAMINIPRKKLMEFAPNLAMTEGEAKSNIVAGKNLIRMNLMGDHSMYVVQVKQGDTIRIKAYCMAWVYQSVTTTTEMRGSAWSLLYGMLITSEYGVSFKGTDIIYRFDPNYDQNDLIIPAGTNVWRMLQICAIILGCKIWFADNKAFIIDYRLIGTYPELNDFSDLVIFGNDPIIQRRCIGKSTVDEEGVDPLANQVSIRCRSSMTDMVLDTTVSASDSASIETFGMKSAGTLDLPELVEYEPGDDSNDSPIDQASVFANNYLSYLKEPQRSITFTMKEVYQRAGDRCPEWKSFFGNAARVQSFYDASTGDVVDNYSALVNHTDEHVPQKLALSSYTRYFPKGACEYSFGIITNIDLSSYASQTTSKLNAGQ